MPDHGARRTERQWAGDALKAKTRKFGVVYPTTQAGFDVDAFATLVAKNGGVISDKIGFVPADAQAGSQQLGTMVTARCLLCLSSPDDHPPRRVRECLVNRSPPVGCQVRQIEEWRVWRSASDAHPRQIGSLLALAFRLIVYSKRRSPYWFPADSVPPSLPSPTLR